MYTMQSAIKLKSKSPCTQKYSSVKVRPAHYANRLFVARNLASLLPVALGLRLRLPLPLPGLFLLVTLCPEDFAERPLSA